MAGIALTGSGVGHNRIRIDCDGTNNIFNVVHNLGTRFLIVQIWDEANYELVYADIVYTDNDTVQVTFEVVPPGTDNYLVHIISKMDSF